MDLEDWVPRKAFLRRQRETRRRCDHCSDFLGYLVYGWGLLSEDSLLGQPVWRFRQRKDRQELLSIRDQSEWGHVPAVEVGGCERPLTADDDRHLWEQAGEDERQLETLFGGSGPGQPREHENLTPETFNDILGNVTDWLRHLGAGGMEDVSDHLETVFGSRDNWPPHLPALFDALQEEWEYKGRNRTEGEWGRDRRGVARRILQALPIECDITYAPACHIAYEKPDEYKGTVGMPAGAPWPWAEGVYEVWRGGRETALRYATYRPCPFSEDYLKGLSRPWRRSDEEG